ncbi:MAG TPA: heparan-alpha-glucosaminide N-acetyltransferase domain-containing protein [Steroidobacteraceae bacterium]
MRAGLLSAHGTSAYLRLARTSKPALARFLLTRGVWLLFLDVVVMRFALQFNLDYHVTVINVLWGLGWSMIVLAPLLWLPLWAIASFGALLVLGHNLLDSLPIGGDVSPLWVFLHQPGVLYSSSHTTVLLSYVLIPWVGVTALGYALGEVYRMEGDRRRGLLLLMGGALVVAFLGLRGLNTYGDPSPWSAQRSPLWSLISFLNTTKYPPSLLFLLMTLGPALLLLRAFDNRVPTALRPALIVGQVPLFFFVLHFFYIHLLAVGVSYLRCGEVREVPGSRSLSLQRALRLERWPTGHLCALGTGRDHAVPTVPLVCRGEATPRHMVAQLSVRAVSCG